jgi:hypothetical protein
MATRPLARRDSTGLWELRPGNDLFGPLDVTTWEPDGRNWHSSFDPSLVTCLPISISGVPVLLHANAGSALVYIPSEKAIFTVRPLEVLISYYAIMGQSRTVGLLIIADDRAERPGR